MQHTIVQYLSEQNRSRCGYCRCVNTSNSHGMHAYIMKPQDYQDLIDRGWRRSGDYCYKPNNPTTCCPSYTIRCNIHEFKLSKSQKKVLKRMSKFLQNGIRDKDEATNIEEKTSVMINGSQDVDGTGGAESLPREEPDIPNMTLVEIDVNGAQDMNPLATNKVIISNDEAKSRPAGVPQQGEKRRDDQQRASSYQDGNRPPCKKAKQMRLERRQAKLAAKGLPGDIAIVSKPLQNSEKCLSDFIEEVHENARHKLTVVIVPSNKGVTKSVIDLYRKYQVAVHKDPPQKITQRSFERFLVRTPLQLKLVEVNSDEFKMTLDASYGLYTKYQTIIHNDPPEDRDDYLFFLQNSPLQYTKTPDGPEQGYGSFHQQYWLDDRLIAVGVIDILPYSVSSVYFFYDPDYNFLSLGTYGSLREVYHTRQLARRTPALKYYYMGFYIHTCPKMIYKGRLSGSYLLCPEVYSWHLLTDEIRRKLDESKYRRINEDPTAKDVDQFTEDDLGLVLIMYNRNSFMTYRNYMQSVCFESVDQVMELLRRTLSLEAVGLDDTRANILEYGQLVGRRCAHSMLYVKI